MTLPIATTDRGFDHHLPVLSRYGGGIGVSESSNAGYPGVWVRTICPTSLVSQKAPPGSDPAAEGTFVEAPVNLHAGDAWTLARQLAATVVGHYHGDCRPDDQIETARRAVVQATGWSPALADRLLDTLRQAGLVLIDVGTTDPTPAVQHQPAGPVRVLDAEPGDGALVAHVGPDGTPDSDGIYVRDDQAAAGDYEPGEHWFPVAGDDDGEYPTSWRELHRDGRRLVLLSPTQITEPGVTVRQEWGVFSAADGSIYTVTGKDHDTAVREAALLTRGVDGDPERTAEPGSAPASRYVVDTPNGTLVGEWSWPSGWTPPPWAGSDTTRQ